MMISPLPSNKTLKLKPGMAMLPFFGVNAILVDEKGNELSNRDSKGILCIKVKF